MYVMHGSFFFDISEGGRERQAAARDRRSACSGAQAQGVYVMFIFRRPSTTKRGGATPVRRSLYWFGELPMASKQVSK